MAVCQNSLFAAASIVTVSGRKLLVNGQTFSIQGVSYSPTPTGNTLILTGGSCAGSYTWWTDRSAYVADFPLIQRLGANTIRDYSALNSASSRAQVLQALDEAHAHNLYVIMGYFVQTYAGYDLSNAANQAQIQSEFLASVSAYKDHPAVLMWVIGNEQNINNAYNNSAWYSFVNSLAGLSKVADPNHPVALIEGECPQCIPAKPFQIGSVALGANDASLPNIDLWGLNIYRGMTFEGTFETLASSTSKPVFVGEFGKDAYRDGTGNEDGAMQASYLGPQWQEISANLSATHAGKIIVGGVVFEWTDEWWKDLGGLSCLVHDTQVIFSRSSDSVDPHYNDEWFGLASILPVDAVSNPDGTARTLRPAYTTLKAFWNPNAAAGNSTTSLFDGVIRNYPNPFRSGSSGTTFVAITNESAKVTVAIYDAGGQFVASLTKTSAGPGRVELLWDGRNSHGTLVSAGLYIARIEGSGGGKEEKQFRRVVAVK